MTRIQHTPAARTPATIYRELSRGTGALDGLTLHPLAEFTPRLDPAALAQLVEDLRERHSAASPVPLFVQGKIVLDDRNRFDACVAGKLPVQCVAWPQFDSPILFLARRNAPLAFRSKSSIACQALPYAAAISSGREQEYITTADSALVIESCELTAAALDAVSRVFPFSERLMEDALRLFRLDRDLFQRVLCEPDFSLGEALGRYTPVAKRPERNKPSASPWACTETLNIPCGVVATVGDSTIKAQGKFFGRGGKRGEYINLGLACRDKNHDASVLTRLDAVAAADLISSLTEWFGGKP
jgi:hypothetical protein